MRSAIVAVVLGLSTWVPAAGAGDADDATAPAAQARARQAAEAHQRAAAAATDRAAAAAESTACGAAYLELFNAEPHAAGADELLYVAATCIARGGDVGVAQQLTAQLSSQFPHSRLAAAALWQSAQLYQAVGLVDQALAASQRYVELYPAEAEALDAQWNAILFAEVLGDEAQVARGAASFERLFGRKRPDDVVRLRQHLARRQAERGEVDDAIRSYDTLLARYHLDADQAALAVVERAELVWQRACPRALTFGLCARGTDALTLVARKADAAEAARKAFAQVANGIPPRDPMTAGAVARARLHLAERAIEAVVAMGTVPPIGYDTSGKAAPGAVKRVGLWMHAWQQALSDAERAATDVVAVPHGPSAIAALARLAHLYLHAAATLEQAPTPRSLVGGPDEAMYRAQLAALAEPMHARAAQVADACLHKAADLSLVTGDVADCGAVLARTQPSAWVQPELLPAFGDAPPAPTPE